MASVDFNQAAFNQFILDNGVIGFHEKPITLKSGRQSHFYVNWRKPTEDAYLTEQLVNHIIAFTRHLGLEPNTFYGVPEGATKLGLFTQMEWARQSPDYKPGSHVLAMGRGKQKEHGAPQDRYFLGTPQGKVIVLEDVTTTGDSLLSTIDQLVSSKVEIIAAFGLTDRMELRNDGRSVSAVIAERDIPYRALSKATLLLPAAYNILKPREEIARAVETEFEQYSAAPLRLK